MNNRIACVIVASERRKGQVYNRVLPSVVRQGFDEIIVAHDWERCLDVAHPNVRWVRVGPVHRNTLDALLKRDAGVLASVSDTIVFVCDDHALAPTFCAELREVLAEAWDVLVPNRYTNRSIPADDLPDNIPLNNGEAEHYCGGHCGVFRRDLVTALPWVRWQALPQPLLWDRDSSFEMRRYGARFVWHPRAGIACEDLIPEASPWL